MEEIINFQGNCLYKTNTNYFLSQNEKNYISNLKYGSTNNNNTNFISKDVFILNNPFCNNLSNFFDSYANYYIKNILELDHQLKRLNSWVTINKNKGFHHPHNHNNVFLSVCFYPQIKEGGIIFKTPQSKLTEKTNISFNTINYNTFNSNKFTFFLSPRDIIIFPGWVEHKGTPNDTDIDRIMIGCNYFIAGEIGNNKDLTNLNLG